MGMIFCPSRKGGRQWHSGLASLGLMLLAATAAAAPAPNANFRGLPGVIYEVEDWTTPRDAWLTNQVTAVKWRLWTTEGPGKRSRDASLTTPTIGRDRARPEEGAPVLS